VYLIQHYVTKFVGDLRQVNGFLSVYQFSSTQKTDRHNMTEILLKVVLNTINQTIYWNLNLPLKMKFVNEMFSTRTTISSMFKSFIKNTQNPNEFT